MHKLISVDSRVTEAEKRTARCPHCGREAEMAAFDAATGIYVKYIRLVPFHDRKILVCPACKQAFTEVPV
ncbi:MAG: hypothetical protein J6X61_06685 [Clostridia bacterium]|nr:hypothetical protein [Clostridia bacterium]